MGWWGPSVEAYAGLNVLGAIVEGEADRTLVGLSVDGFNVG
jgi:hypothetical protein